MLQFSAIIFGIWNTDKRDVHVNRDLRIKCIPDFPSVNLFDEFMFLSVLEHWKSLANIPSAFSKSLVIYS